MENKHEAWHLAQMQSLPLSVKIRMTQDRIRGWYEAFDGAVYVSVSGGKDSTVLDHIVKGMYPDVPSVFVNTGLEFNSVRERGMELADEVLRPKMNFVEVIKTYGYPVISKEIAKRVHEYRKYGENCNAYKEFNGLLTIGDSDKKSFYNKEKWKFLLDAPFKISHYCCKVMKEQTAHYYEKETERKPFIGTLADESKSRKNKWLRNGCNAFEQNRPTSQPLSFWTEQDILQYIKDFNLKIADIYGDIVYYDKFGEYTENPFGIKMDLKTTGADRTGCVFCMFGITQDTERFLRLKEVEPIKYDYIMRGGAFDTDGYWKPAPDENGKMGLGYKFVIDWLNEHGNLNIKY